MLGTFKNTEMKVKDLIKKLENIDPEMLVFCTSNTGEYEYCIVNTAHVSSIRIDGVNDPEIDDDETDVFLIDEQ
jgi:hypothetical protein